MKTIIARLWRLIRGPLQWRVLWLWHAKFMVGVTGIVRDGEGRVLLLRHRMWPPDRQWGCPTGYANKGETFEDTIVREVREETGLEVELLELVGIYSDPRHVFSYDDGEVRQEFSVCFCARPVKGTLTIGSESLDVRYFALADIDDLPMVEYIRLRIADSMAGGGPALR